MPNGQSLVHVNFIQNGRLEHVADCVSSGIVSLVKDQRFLQMIRKNIFTHFAKSWCLSFTEMHVEKAGGVSCFVQQTHTNIV